MPRKWAGRDEWFEIKQGMVFEVLRHGPTATRWLVTQTPFDGHGTARMCRLDDNGQQTDEWDTVWWTELFADTLLVEERGDGRH